MDKKHKIKIPLIQGYFGGLKKREITNYYMYFGVVKVNDLRLIYGPGVKKATDFK